MDYDILIAKYLKIKNNLDVNEICKYFSKENINFQEFKNRVTKIKKYRKILKKLKTIPVIPQKSEEWLEARKNMISASDFAQALGDGKFGSSKQLIEKKCIDDDSVSKSNPIFEWGNMFEPICSDIYSELLNVKMYEFGLLKHPTRNYFGASPDGISNLGILLEIKAPYRRKIDGEIPLQYFYQIQGQLEVTNLDECDFFECEFLRFENYNEYLNEYNSKEYNYTGFIEVELINENKKNFKYEITNNICSQKVSNNKIYYWILNKYNLKRVNRDQSFIDSKLEELNKIWNKIIEYRNDNELFQREVKNSMYINTQSFSNSKCMIINLEP